MRSERRVYEINISPFVPFPQEQSETSTDNNEINAQT